MRDTDRCDVLVVGAKLFAFLGQLDRIEAAGFYPNQGNVVRRARALRLTRSTDSGFHVSRGAFDQVLRDAAAAARVRVVHGAAHRPARAIVGAGRASRVGGGGGRGMKGGRPILRVRQYKGHNRVPR